jgi:hypothetical protein
VNFQLGKSGAATPKASFPFFFHWIQIQTPFPSTHTESRTLKNKREKEGGEVAITHI